jgi:hypothetical protein
VVCKPVIPALRKLKQENQEFKASLEHVVRLSQKQNTQLAEWLKW